MRRVSVHTKAGGKGGRLEVLVARRTGRGACRLDWPRVRSSCLVLRGWEGGGHGWAWVGGWVGWVGVHVPDEGVGHGLEVMAGKQEAAQGRHVQVGQAALVGKAWRRLRVLYLGIGLVVLVPWGWSGHGASSKKGGRGGRGREQRRTGVWRLFAGVVPRRWATRGGGKGVGDSLCVVWRDGVPGLVSPCICRRAAP